MKNKGPVQKGHGNLFDESFNEKPPKRRLTKTKSRLEVTDIFDAGDDFDWIASNAGKKESFDKVSDNSSRKMPLKARRQ